jgi:hypothetical protein
MPTSTGIGWRGLMTAARWESCRAVQLSDDMASWLGSRESILQRSKVAIVTPERIPVSLTINGAEAQLGVAPWTTLLDALRDHVGLTGKKGVAITANVARAP